MFGVITLIIGIADLAFVMIKRALVFFSQIMELQKSLLASALGVPVIIVSLFIVLIKLIIAAIKASRNN